MQNKNGGGMGVRNLKVYNMSLFFKCFWRPNEDKEEAWKGMIIIKYRIVECWKHPTL